MRSVTPTTAPVRPRVLVAGIGNIFLGDDGFGVHVAASVRDREMPADVTVADFGIRGLHLAYELLDGYDVLVLLDALETGGPPGTLAVVEVVPPAAEGGEGPGAGEAAGTSATGSPSARAPCPDRACVQRPWAGAPQIAHAPQIDGHSMSPAAVLSALARLGGSVGRVVIVGCQPHRLEEGVGLSAAVSAAVDPAAELCVELVRGLGEGTPAWPATA